VMSCGPTRRRRSSGPRTSTATTATVDSVIDDRADGRNPRCGWSGPSAEAHRETGPGRRLPPHGRIVATQIGVR
jgi:hypothetical protein